MFDLETAIADASALTDEAQQPEEQQTKWEEGWRKLCAAYIHAQKTLETVEGEWERQLLAFRSKNKMTNAAMAEIAGIAPGTLSQRYGNELCKRGQCTRDAGTCPRGKQCSKVTGANDTNS